MICQSIIRFPQKYMPLPLEEDLRKGKIYSRRPHAKARRKEEREEKNPLFLIFAPLRLRAFCVVNARKIPSSLLPLCGINFGVCPRSRTRTFLRLLYKPFAVFQLIYLGNYRVHKTQCAEYNQRVSAQGVAVFKLMV